MDSAIEYAKHKMKMFPEAYKDYIDDSALFSLLVEDCRRQLEIEAFSMKLLRGGGVGYEQSTI